MAVYDCIVVGFGGVGSAALYYAAKKGWKVLGIDRFGVAHNKGSSHGQTRVIRAAYFEHPNYVPLCQRAFFLWEELQRECRHNLITRNGLLQVGDPQGEIIQGIQASANEHDLEIEEWTTAEVMKRYPIFKLPSEHVAVFEKDAGFLRVERCVANFVKLAVENGAETVCDSTVTNWEAHDDGTFTVTTEAGDSYSTRRLIVAAGCWSEKVLGLSMGIQVIRKQQHWFQLDRIEQKLGNGFPCFLMELGDRCFYGFPEIDYLGMKVAEHSGGTEVSDPLNVDRSRDSAELAGTEEFLDARFEFTRKRLVYDSTCMYTCSPDHHFIIDKHPECENLAFVAGLSGHGFKFSPVIGMRLIDMLEGKNDPLFDFFRIR